jgi:hypothetical protein
VGNIRSRLANRTIWPNPAPLSILLLELCPYISTVPSPPSPPSCAPENIFSPITITTVSNESYPPPYFRLPGHVPIPFFEHSCLWGHWVWEREKGCRSGVSVVVAVLVCLVLSGVNEYDNTLQRYCHVHSSQTRKDTASSVFDAVLEI